MRKVTITGGWFRAAGNVFHWRSSKNHIFGVGIALEILKAEKEIEVEVEGDLYRLDTVKAREFIQAYNSLKRVGKGRWLGVVSKSILTPMQVAEIASPKLAEEEIQITTGKLF